RPSVPPLRRKRGKPGRRAESSRPAEWSAGDGRVRTPAPTGIVGEKRWAHNVRPYTAFTNGSIYKKRDRSGTCPLKRRGEAELRRKFLCLLSFSKKVRQAGGEGGEAVPQALLEHGKGGRAGAVAGIDPLHPPLQKGVCHRA